MNGKMRSRQGKDHLAFGIAIAATGILILLHLTGYIPLNIKTGWPLILVVIGLLIGIKNRFRKNAWWILVLIGGAHMIPRFEINGTPSTRLIWPVIMIIAGLFIAFTKPRRCRNNRDFDVFTNNDNNLNIDVTFGGRKEIITSKEFNGGTIQASFSGCEINLMQADNPGHPMLLNMKVAFGGIELIVPSHWEIKNEITPFAGSVEDHRTIRSASGAEEKRTLILKGSVSFGSVEIKSY